MKTRNGCCCQRQPFDGGLHLLLLTAVIWEILPIVQATTTTTCSLCGVYGPPTIPFPDKPLPAAARPLSQCLDLEESSFFIEADTAACEALQAIGTYCGCNTPPDACHLCWNGSRAIHKNLTLSNYTASDLLGLNGYDSSLDCETLEAFLHNVRTSDSQECFDIQLDVGQQCGCPPIPEEVILSRNNTNSTTDNNNNNATGVAVDEETPSSSLRRCTLCETGDPPPYPDRVVDTGGGGIQATCSEWDTVAAAFEDGSGDCSLVRIGASRLCNCPVPEGLCTMCPLGEPIPYPNQELNWLSDFFLSSDGDAVQSGRDIFLNCQLMESHVTAGYPLLEEVFGSEEELICTAMQMKSWICGCQPDWRQIALTWCYRLSGILSLTGSSLIIISILRKPNRRFTTYHQLVLGISIFDMISSIAYMLVGVMAPYEAGFYLSRGNQTTCKMQGFMIQLGQTASMFYNLCLSLYFFTVIMLSWRERFLRKVLVGAHVCVIATGLGLSIGALPYIEAQFGVCGILPPLTASQWQISLFYTVPVSIVLIVLALVTLSICWRVYSQQARARKKRWRMEKRASVAKKVFWQSFWYVSAFYVTLPFVLLSFYVKFESSRYFWIYIATAILAPLQGTMNALIYFQRSKDVQAFFARVCCWCRQTPKRVQSPSERRSSIGFSNNNYTHMFEPEPSTDSMEATPLVDDDNNNKMEDNALANIDEFSADFEDMPESNAKDAIEEVEPHPVYLQDDHHHETSSAAESNEHTRHGYKDPLELQGVAMKPRRREKDLKKLQAMTQPDSSLQDFFRRSKNQFLLEEEEEDEEEEGEEVEDEESRGVLEYWTLHGEESSLAAGTTSTSATRTSLRLGRTG